MTNTREVNGKKDKAFSLNEGDPINEKLHYVSVIVKFFFIIYATYNKEISILYIITLIIMIK